MVQLKENKRQKKMKQKVTLNNESDFKEIMKEETDVKLSPLIKSLKGSFKMPKNFEYKKELKNTLTEKYSL